MDKNQGVAAALIIDPGGVRGISPARIMQEIEERTGHRITELFDVMAFTSTGQIPGAIVNLRNAANPEKARYPSSFGVEAYERFATVAFPHRRLKILRQIFGEAKYDHRPYEKLLNDTLGDTRVNECRTGVMFYATDVRTSETVCIKHIRDHTGKVIDENLSTMRLCDVVAGGTTAPTYHKVREFDIDPGRPETGRIALMDAGGSAGNVVHEVYHALNAVAPPGARRIIVHLGTGYGKVDMTPQRYNLRGLAGFLLGEEKRRHFLAMTFNAPARASTNFMKRKMGRDFFSFDGVIDRDNPDHPTLELDDGRAENMQRHRMFAENHMISANEVEMRRLCDVLVERFMYAPAETKSGIRLIGDDSSAKNDNIAPPPGPNLIVLPGGR